MLLVTLKTQRVIGIFQKVVGHVLSVTILTNVENIHLFLHKHFSWNLSSVFDPLKPKFAYIMFNDLVLTVKETQPVSIRRFNWLICLGG